MTAYVILHYRAIDSTRQCVDCIKALEGENHAVIVDNASPDGTGRQLLEEYAGDPGVTVLLNGENSGFARGNNLGVRFAVQELSPDFIVVLNNDVEVRQKDFSTRIAQIYEQHPFDLLGPDILSIFSGIHQSPKTLRGISLASVRKKIDYVKRSQNPILMLLSSGEKNSPAIWRMAQRQRRAKQNINTDVPAEGVVLHGSCVIFSRRYLERHPEPFYPKTFMYFEMEILEWLCRREGSVIRYDPSINVLHYQYMASKIEYRSIVKRSKFVASCLLDSLHAAEELILSAEQDAAVPAAEEKHYAPDGLALADV